MGQDEDKFRPLNDEEREILNNLFEKYSKEQTDFGEAVRKGGYAIEKEVPIGSLLFISMNPSYSDPEDEENDPWKNAVYYFGEEENNDYELKATNSFFKQIRKFYNELKENSNILPPLAHHDLLFIRETNQNNVKKWMENKIRIADDKGKPKWVNKNDKFFEPQLHLSKKIIKESEPRLIVVLNAGARRIFNTLFNPDGCNNSKDLDDEKNYPPFCEKLGAYMYKLGDSETRTPVLFSGMLSGQRALDLGSRRSLRWHIEYILKNLNKTNL